MGRRLKHYKGTQQVEFLQLTSLFLTTPDCQKMLYTHEILYDDQAVAFVDVATQKQIQDQLQNTGKSPNKTATCLAAHPSTPDGRANKPTYAAQLENLKLLVKPPQTKPTATSTSCFEFPQIHNKTQEIPKSPKPQMHKKKLQPDEDFHPSDSDDSSIHDDKTLSKDKSFITSTLKNLTDLNCSKPRQPDHIDNFTNPTQVEHTNNNIQPPTSPRYIEVKTRSSQTDPNDIEKPQNYITSHKITFLKQIITHPIHQFSKIALLMAHNSLPNVQPVTPDGTIQKDFVLKLETYMNNMFQTTHAMIVDHCKANGYTLATAQPLHMLLHDRYFMLTQKPHYIIKHFSDDDKEKVCWVCLRMFKKPGHLKNHWAHTNHEAFTQLKNDGHAISNNDCNKHFKELIFPIITHTRALPCFYFTQQQ